ncbi:uncharacterized protein LOC111711691 isoform X3 [Eurytemora carolleeae]|uniref:uncharacterized protein LOC111711691 isoform X3 n=1 Tax=Eurytemora carolleeae TaxID=1294199 RepID=UPI000C77EBDF|nr:uncharacterized protein LOC111711691 isoform X3 [Eurytemora carolleeae]|eukprot:XP_023341862.1 uncharacterized protein LOC111711691 isoform X3 [Eurytemora affinis]
MLDKKEIELEVGLSWDGEEKIENSAKIFLSASGDDLAVRLVAPYYGDLAPPGGQPGEPYSNLWDYEVVELFFLNDAEEYLELEFGPHAQHLVLLLKGTRLDAGCIVVKESCYSINGKNYLYSTLLKSRDMFGQGRQLFQVPIFHPYARKLMATLSTEQEITGNMRLFLRWLDLSQTSTEFINSELLI